jgi:hypothetical protein
MSTFGFPRWCAACSASLVLMSLAVLGSPPQASGKGSGVSFQPFYEYKIVFNGKGSYTRSVSDEGGGLLKEEASWTWNTIYPEVLIPTTASSPLAAAGFPAYGVGQLGDGTWTITNTGSEGEDCSNSGTLGLPKQGEGTGGGGVTVKRPGVGLSKGVIFNMDALESYETTSGAGNGDLACDPEDYWHDIIESFAGVGYKHTDPGLPDVHPLTAKIQLSPSELKHASVTKHVSVGAAEMVPSDCGSGGGVTCQQDYTWSGSVKFIKHKLG